MRLLRFLGRELLLHGIVFAIAGTVALLCLYLFAIGAPPEGFARTGTGPPAAPVGLEGLLNLSSGLQRGENHLREQQPSPSREP